MKLFIVFVIFVYDFCRADDVYELSDFVSKSIKRLPRHNAKINSYRWANATIPYKFDMTNYTQAHVDKIREAMKIVENSTCIRFINRKKEKDFVRITGNSYHCGTKIGRRGGEHILSILDKESCFRTASIIHELMHIIGFHHMHTSANRDEFIKILWENVAPEKFRKFRIKENLQDLGVDYDYGSVMHYTQYAYSKNGKKTIIPLKDVEEGLKMGQRETLSEKDILRINRLYDCDVVNEIIN